MAALDDIYALLPDNTTGDIDAADLREAFRIVHDSMSALIASATATIQAGQLALNDLDARVAVLEGTPGGGTPSVTIDGTWQINPADGVVPGGRQVSSDVGFRQATWLRFDPFDQANEDMTTTLMNASAVYAQQQSNSDQWVRYTVTGPATATGSSYIEIPVSVVANGGNGNSAQWQNAIFVFWIPVA